MVLEHASSARAVCSGGAVAIVMALAVVVLFFFFNAALMMAGVGPGASFVHQMSAGAAAAVESGAALVNMNRLILLPAITLVFTVSAARIDVARVGTYAAAAAGAVAGGYPSARATAMLFVAYVALAVRVRALRRRCMAASRDERQ